MCCRQLYSRLYSSFLTVLYHLVILLVVDRTIFDRIETLREKQWTPDELQAFRKAFRLTRRALGQLIGVTVSSIYQWERGLKQPSMTARILLSLIEEELAGKSQNKKGGK